MGTEVRGVPEAAALTGEPEAADSIGRYLARQRELRSISLDELSAQTKIPIRSLQRLESGAFDRDPDGFARGFVRTVAEALGLDPSQAVMRLLREPPEEAVDDPRQLPWGAAARAGGLALAGLLALVLGAWALSSSRAPGPVVPAPEVRVPAGPDVVYRLDAVRSLVEDQIRAQPPPPPPEPVAGSGAGEGGAPAPP